MACPGDRDRVEVLDKLIDLCAIGPFGIARRCNGVRWRTDVPCVAWLP